MQAKRRYDYRWQQHDPRDYVNNVPYHVQRNLPPIVDLVTPTLSAPFEPSLDQGQEGSCGPHSETHHIMFDVLKSGKKILQPSPRYIYYITRVFMGLVGQDSGVDNRTMMKAVAQYGWCDNALCPYYDAQGNLVDFRIKPSSACYRQGVKRAVPGYMAVPQTLQSIWGCLATGKPFILGFTVYESFETSEVDSTGDVPMPNRSEQVLGGHDVLAVGIDTVTGKIKFKNSYGGVWGKRGYGTLPLAYVTDPNLAGDYWTFKAT